VSQLWIRIEQEMKIIPQNIEKIFFVEHFGIQANTSQNKLEIVNDKIIVGLAALGRRLGSWGKNYLIHLCGIFFLFVCLVQVHLCK